MYQNVYNTGEPFCFKDERRKGENICVKTAGEHITPRNSKIKGGKSTNELLARTERLPAQAKRRSNHERHHV
jgi:hypothetical protein